MASHSNRDHTSRLRRHSRQSRQNRTVASVLDVDDEALETSATCIDLTVDVSGDDIIDLTRGHNISIMDSPVVVLTQADDVGPIRTRRGSGRRGRHRTGSGRTLFPSSSSVNPPPHQVHVLPSDSDSDELPELPFAVTTSSGNSASILQSPEGVRISCPVCLDDARHIRRSGRQIMSTTCGHIFCGSCIKTAITSQHACPTCRKKLSQRNIHPLFL